MEIKKELLAKAKNTKTPEELLCLAKENGEEMTEESAKAYFELLHPQTGELADNELDNVSGGNCYNSGRLVVTTRFRCWDWQCKNGCAKDTVETSVSPYRRVCRNCGNVSGANTASIARMKEAYGFATTQIPNTGGNYKNEQ